MTIWDKLAALEGACVHAWVLRDDDSETEIPYLECTKCGRIRLAGSFEEAPAVGDGNNEARFNSLDALVALCDRLPGIRQYGLTTGWREAKFRAYVVLTDDAWTICEVCNDDPRLALATAILRAKGVGV